jgi:transcription initiation factor TFIIB
VATGVHPAGVAAACLFKAGREDGRWLTQSGAIDVANVTAPTIRSHQTVLGEVSI